MKKHVYVLLIMLLLIGLTSCSNRNPIDTSDALQPDTASDTDVGRSFLGTYTVNLDPETQTASIEPNREINFHMNAKQYLLGWPCGNCLQIKNLQFMPGNIVECDIEVRHPVSDPVFTVFDLRVIAMFPPTQYYYGVGISTALLNGDGFTSIWDSPSVPGELNGYKAYNKTENRRPFGPGDVFSEHFIIQLPSGGFTYDIGVDASWAPNDGINFPLTMNSFEVINLTGNITAGLTTEGGSAQISANMYDYQGFSTIASVTAYCQDLFTAPIALSYDSGDGYNAVYKANITNQKLAPQGHYNVLVQVTDIENANYPYDVSSYVILQAEVLPVITDVEITLAEDDDYKTPGNFYNFLANDGPADTSVIDYLDFDGPWDFTQLSFTGAAVKKSFAPNDPEVSGFSGDFPGAQHFMKNQGNFGISTGQYYQAEKHDYARSECVPLGIYEEEQFGGSVVFDGTISGFPYPYNINTSFKRKFKQGTIIETISVLYDTKALGIGLCKIPLNGGTTKSALLLRTTIDAKIFGIDYARALLYEWYDDDGNLLAMAASANLTGEDPNWNETTYVITGEGGFIALNEIFRQ